MAKAASRFSSRQVAKQLAAAATMRGLRAVAVSVADYKVSDLRGERNLILVSSTQGEGDPPDAAAAGGSSVADGSRMLSFGHPFHQIDERMNDTS